MINYLKRAYLRFQIYANEQHLNDLNAIMLSSQFKREDVRKDLQHLRARLAQCDCLSKEQL